MEDKFKTFYLKNIHSFRIDGGAFKQNGDALDRLEKALNVWFEPNSPLFEVRLLIRSNIVKYFERRPLSVTQKLLNDIAYLLLDQAKLSEGMKIEDTAAFAKRLNRFIAKAL